MTDELEKLLTKLATEQQTRPQRHVVFVDMLGFSSLTETHPDSIVWDFESPDMVASTTSESASQLGRFQYVLNTVPADEIDGTSPSHVMLFSDCAFLVYDNALQAALSSTSLMRRFFHQAVPVRMGLAYGTWHVQRFSFDSFQRLTITRAVFYGTGVVRATKAEKDGGKGCRIFVHRSLTESDVALIRDQVPVQSTPEKCPEAPNELNYLHPHDGINIKAADKDSLFRSSLREMQSRLEQPIPPAIERQYVDTFAALSRMRKHLGRPEFSVDG